MASYDVASTIHQSLVIGGMHEALEPFCKEVMRELGPRLREAHFHRCTEYPTKHSLFT
jgi:hypothetical protein